jgi:transcriptional repressor NrdR
MKCPYCSAENKSRVVDTTRDAQGGIRRRRECQACDRRFSTYEKVLHATPLLIKGNGAREAFDREKLISGIQISCAKRPISAAAINTLVDRIETHLQHLGRDEVSSRVVGDMVIEALKEIDPIAYIRYAIVYLGLDSLTSVRDMIDGLLDPAPTGKRTSKPAAQSSATTDAASSAQDDDVPGDGKAGATVKTAPVSATTPEGAAPENGSG